VDKQASGPIRTGVSLPDEEQSYRSTALAVERQHEYTDTLLVLSRAISSRDYDCEGSTFSEESRSTCPCRDHVARGKSRRPK
jgi:hypothetical protein